MSHSVDKNNKGVRAASGVLGLLALAAVCVGWHAVGAQSVTHTFEAGIRF